MLNPQELAFTQPEPARAWDARLARWLVTPLKRSWVHPNHLTTVRLLAGLGAALSFAQGAYGWTNFGALMLVLSNFLDHTDGELARISGKTSHFGHVYDLASDAVVTILVFMAIGVGVAAGPHPDLPIPALLLGAIAGTAISIIFYMRMRIESAHGKSATKQASIGGFETEDVLYLMPLATLSNIMTPLLVTAAICAPLFAIWVAIDYRRVMSAE
jgi:archaetidylinositol phosphate synthase